MTRFDPLLFAEEIGDAGYFFDNFITSPESPFGIPAIAAGRRPLQELCDEFKALCRHLAKLKLSLKGS